MKKIVAGGYTGFFARGGNWIGGDNSKRGTVFIYTVSGIECVCQKNATLRVFTACAKFLRALI